MKRKLVFMVISAIMFSVGILQAENISHLESLWNAALTTNVDVKAAETEAFGAGFRRRYFSSIYAPTVVVKGSNTFAPNPQRENGTVSDMSTFSLGYGQPFSGGGNLSTTIGYSLTRPLTPDGTYAVQSPSVNVSLSQGLNPWWLQGLKKNPEKSLLENAVLLQEIRLVRQKKSVLVALTRDFLELRKTERVIALLEKTLCLRLETITSLELLFKQGALSMTKIWDEKQLFIDDENALVQNRGERDRLKEQLRTACGTAVENACLSMLPVNASSRTYPGSLDAGEIETQLTSLSLSKAQRKQNTAPSFTLSADISWPLETEKLAEWKKAWVSALDDKQKPLYTISLGVDLSPLFSGAGVRDTRIDENNALLLEVKKESVLSTEENQKTLLKTNLSALRAQTEQYRAALTQSALLTADAEALAKQGALTSLELQTYRLQTQKREASLADSEDQTWYLEWYIEWWME